MPLSEPIKAVVAEMGRRFAREVQTMRGEMQEQLADFLAETRKLTKEHGEIRDRQVEQAVQAATARVERDLRAYVTQRVNRAMADLVDDIGKRDRVKEPHG